MLSPVVMPVLLRRIALEPAFFPPRHYGLCAVLRPSATLPAQPAPQIGSGSCHTTAGLPVLLPSPSSMRAAANTPAGPALCACRSLPGQCQPSPTYRRVGSRIPGFEAGSCVLWPVPRYALKSPIPLWNARPSRVSAAHNGYDQVAIAVFPLARPIRVQTQPSVAPDADAVHRHLAAPLARSRGRCTSLTVPSRAPGRPRCAGPRAEVKVIHYLELGEQGKVARPDIEAAARRWVSQDPARRGRNADIAQRHFVSHATCWLRFAGRLEDSAISTHPHSGEVADFVDYMRQERGCV